ncbi:RNA polymerase sigma factor [uncultured Pseudoteredinibacter sp.]|uniref:RNA polymerase sigma factor n=1 Tax=uncultured Pseudoteredinibacter sp. TaxID=1641701 RepID=UPI00262A3171|nr:RNA polymerase sigma factor [uncultured Pseudoteredinibacter sp.]
MIELSDQQLIDLVVKAGNQRAFAILVNRHQSGLRASLRQWCQNDALADDLAQETFLKAFRKLDSFQSNAKLSTWLYRIAYNTFLDYKKIKKNNFQDTFEDIDNVHSAAGSDLEHVGNSRDLDQALAQLPDIQRQTIDLCYTQGMSHSEAAEILQCPVGSVKSHVQRAKQKLKAILAAPATAQVAGE